MAANPHYKLEIHGLGWWVMHQDQSTRIWHKEHFIGSYPRMSRTDAENAFRAYVRKQNEH